MKIIYLKLGGRCNYHCKHCHNNEVDYEYNPDIIPYIKNNNYSRVTFGGGEPLLYWDLIKKICIELGKGYEYKFVTNGSLLTREMTSFIEDYQIQVCVSFDGSDGTRDCNPPPNWRQFANVKKASFATVVYKENMNLPKIQSELIDLCKQYEIPPKLSLQPEFIHTTEDVEVTNDIEVAKEYCQQMAPLLEKEIVSVVANNWDQHQRFQRFMQCFTLRKALMKWFAIKSPTKGVRCFTEGGHCMTISGIFLLCPYSTKRVIGDIYSGIDWNKLQSYIPEKCKKCNLFRICRCSCVAEVNGNECYIARTMNRWLMKIAEKYHCYTLLNYLYFRYMEQLNDKAAIQIASNN